MSNSRKTRASKSNQPNSTRGGSQAESSTSARNGFSSGSLPSTAMDEAVLQRAEKRKVRAAENVEKLEARKNAGNDLFKAGDYLGAVEVYQEAIDEFGRKPVLTSNLAAAYLKLEEYEPAEEAATTALMYDPRMLKARYRRGLARKGMSHFKAAMIDFKSVLKQDPTKVEAREQLKLTEELYNQLGDDDDNYYDDSDSSDSGWPHPHDTPEKDSEVESDSSDCNHFGNGFPCRFYNHEGCSKKENCRYSHAPDDKSERDKLGRNVCIYFLLGMCKFGAAKCVYAHDKTYLPHGWWDHNDLVAMLKETFSYTEIEAQGKHAFSDFLSLSTSDTPCFKRPPAGEHVVHGGFAKVAEGTGAKEALRPTGKQTSVASESSSECFVLLMVLDGDANEDYKQSTLASLRAKTPVKNALSASEAFTHLASHNLAGVFVADAALSRRKNSRVLSKLVEYARNGGSVVIGGSFSSFVRPPDMATFFANAWGVDWKSGSYHRATFSLNASHDLAKSNPALPSLYSMKAVHVQGVTPSAAIYKEPSANPTESPAVQIRFGKGYMGYIGDVNWEEGSVTLLLAMLHLSGTPSPVPAVPRDGAAKVASGTKAASPDAAQSVEANGAGPSKVPTSTQQQAFTTAASSSQIFVLLLALEGDMVEAYKHPTIAAIKAKAPVKTASSVTDVLAHLASPSLGGVFVTDAGIIKRQHSQVLKKLVEYAKAGGSVIIGGAFSSFVKPQDMSQFFEISWGVNWKPGSYHRTTFFLNPAHELAKINSSLPSSYSMKALHVKDLPPDDMVYRPTQESRLQSLVFSSKPVSIFNESPAIRTRIGKGSLGYIGDVNWEEGSSKLVLAMLGLLDPQVVPRPQPIPSTHTPKSAIPTPKDPNQALPAASPSTLRPVPSTQKSVPPSSTEPKQTTSAMGTATFTKPIVMLLSLDNEDLFATSHAHCLSSLRDKVETFQALTASSALMKLDSTALTGVFITDAGIVKADNAHVLSRVVEYAKSGGSVVVGGLFSTFVSGGDMEAFFKNAWGLPWRAASYHRASFSLNSSHEMVKKNTSLTASYSMKALHVGQITAADVVYLPSDDLQLQQSIVDHSESPVVHRRIGSGSLGYIGDVNAEPETTNVLLAMLDLLDTSRGNQKVEAARVSVPKPSVDVPAPSADVSAQLKAPKVVPAGPTSRPFMMVLSFGNEKLFAVVQGNLLELLRSKLEVLHGLSNERVIELLGSPDLVGILVTDAGVADAENAYLLGKLVAFAKAGGMVVMGGSFGSTMKFDDIGRFFQDSWGVPWRGGDYANSDVTINRKHEIVTKNLELPSAFCMKALHISGVTQETAVYLPVKASQVAAPAKNVQAPVALAPIEKGYLGYIGDIGLQDEHSKIVLAMFGLT